MLCKSLQTNQHIYESDQHPESLNGWKFTYDQLSEGHFDSHLQEIFFDDIQIYQEKIKLSMFLRGCAEKISLCVGLFGNLPDPVLCMGKALSGYEIFSIWNGGDILLRSPENSTFYSSVHFELQNSKNMTNMPTCWRKATAKHSMRTILRCLII